MNHTNKAMVYSFDIKPYQINFLTVPKEEEEEKKWNPLFSAIGVGKIRERIRLIL